MEERDEMFLMPIVMRNKKREKQREVKWYKAI